MARRVLESRASVSNGQASLGVAMQSSSRSHWVRVRLRVSVGGGERAEAEARS